MSCIVCTVGIPASGKSEFCRLLSARLKVQFPHYSVLTVCYDYLIPWEQLTQDSMFEWKSRRRLIAKAVNELLDESSGQSAHSVEDTDVEQMKLNILKWNLISTVHSVNAKLIIIIDDNLYYSSMRYEFYQVAKSKICGYCQVYLHCDVKTALERNKLREENAVVHDSTIREMSEKLEEPNTEKNEWEQNYLVINSEKPFSNIEIESAIKVINIAINNPITSHQQQQLQIEEKEKSREACSMNVIHQVDVRLRKLTKHVIKEFGFTKDKIEKVHGAKSSVLQDIKQRIFCLPPHLVKSITEGKLNHKDEENVNAMLLDYFRQKLKPPEQLDKQYQK